MGVPVNTERNKRFAKLWLEGMPREKMADIFGFSSVDSVSSLASRLELPMRGKKSAFFWSPEMDAILRDGWGKKKVTQLAIELGSYQQAVSRRAAELGLPPIKMRNKEQKRQFPVGLQGALGNVEAHQRRALGLPTPYASLAPVPAVQRYRWASKPIPPAVHCCYVVRDYKYPGPDPFCGEQVLDGTPYCAEHYRVTHVHPTPLAKKPMKRIVGPVESAARRSW